MDTSVKIQIIRYEEIDSTNLEVTRLSEQGAAEGTVVVADSQTAGRGRRGRTWLSPQGEALYMSLLLRPKFAPNEAASLTLVMALAVMEALEEIIPNGCRIKWPNDIVVDGKKVCGILTEMGLQGQEIAHVVIGVGINLNQTNFDEEIAKTATSLKIKTGKYVDRFALLDKVVYYFKRNYEIFLQTCDMRLLVDKYNGFLINCGKEVRVLDPQGEYEGIAQGINEKGELLVEKHSKEIVAVYAGEVSVRGIYGYV